MTRGILSLFFYNGVYTIKVIMKNIDKIFTLIACAGLLAIGGMILSEKELQAFSYSYNRPNDDLVINVSSTDFQETFVKETKQGNHITFHSKNNSIFNEVALTGLEQLSFSSSNKCLLLSTGYENGKFLYDRYLFNDGSNNFATFLVGECYFKITPVVEETFVVDNLSIKYSCSMSQEEYYDSGLDFTYLDESNSFEVQKNATFDINAKEILIPRYYFDAEHGEHNITSIANNGFSGCLSENVYLPNSINNIGSYAFENCHNLDNIYIPNSVITIGCMAFNNCDVLTINCETLNQPSGWDSDWNIDANPVVWGYGYPYNTVYLDAGEGYVDNSVIRVFENKSYSLPIPEINKMELDWEYGFDCWTLDGEEIPSSGLEWTYGNNKTLIAQYKLRDDDEYLESKYDFALENDTYTLNGKGGIEHQYVYVPSTYKGKNITKIGYHAFAGEISILAVSFPDTLTAIDDHAFNSCQNLKSVVIPNSVTTLGKFVFRYCYALESVVLPKNLVTIPAYAFENNTALVSVNIPSSVKYIEDAAFFNCSKLESIFIPRSVETINFLSFRFCDKLNFACESLSKPEGWQDNWNYGRPVIWGYGHTYNITYPNWPNDVPNPNPTSNTVPNEITLDQHAFDNYSKYIFMGYVDKDNKPITKISKFVHDDIEIYADYAKKNITLILEEYGTKKFTYNEEYELPTLPNKQVEGGEYIFDHWTLNGETIPLSGEHWTYSRDNATLVPSYNFLNHYTITYVLNGGSINPQNPTTYTVNDDVVLRLSSKKGCEFDGWYLSPDFTGDKVEGWSAGSKQGNITLYAKFNLKEYPIFYDNWPSEILDNPNPETYTIEDEVVFYTDPTGKFKTLKYLTSKEGQPITKIEKGTTGPIFLDIDYELQTTDLVFNAAGGLFPNPQDERFIYIDYCMDDMENEKVSVPTVGDTSLGFNINSKAPYHKGYNFAGWYLDKGYTTRISDNNILSSGDTIYAKWEKLPEDGSFMYDSLANPQFGYWQRNEGSYRQSYKMYIPYNMESIQLYVDFSNNNETGDGMLAEFDISTDKSVNPIFELDYIDYPCNYETPLIDLRNLEYLEYYLYLYTSNSGGCALFDTMFKQCNYKKQYIKVADTGPCYAQAIYSEMVTLPNDPYREGYTFAGWMDKDGNLIDFSKPWSRKDYSLELSAKWIEQ